MQLRPSALHWRSESFGTQLSWFATQLSRLPVCALQSSAGLPVALVGVAVGGRCARVAHLPIVALSIAAQRRGPVTGHLVGAARRVEALADVREGVSTERRQRVLALAKQPSPSRREPNASATRSTVLRADDFIVLTLLPALRVPAPCDTPSVDSSATATGRARHHPTSARVEAANS